MKEIAVISGKGGTGKTTVAAALAGLCKGEAVITDCDVDASNLPLILTPDIVRKEEFKGSKMAVKNPDLCISCGQCRKVCRFGAIDENFDIISVKCEGCGTCTLVCPEHALSMVERVTGKVFVSTTRCGPLVHAELFMGEEASGKLVTQVRDVAAELAEKKAKDLILIDGSPGIGCPVIASIVGTSLVVIVTEPTLSGMYDLDRIYQVVNHFSIPCCMCINKYDINIENGKKIESWCKERDIPIVGILPYDTRVTEAMVLRKTLIEHNCLSEPIKGMWEKIQQIV
ncbi:MAG: ATP-binding protein [Theionarchaea archaeon]|nr:ATP-binding protein [Theionarchaea archaeon]